MPRPLREHKPRTFTERVAAQVRARRLRKKLTVEEAARAAGVPAPTWYHFEAGRSLTLERLPAIAAALGCTPRALLPAD